MKRMGVLLIVSLVIGCSNKSDVDKLNFLKRGNIAYENGQNKQAVRYYNEALAIDSTFVDALNNRGLAEMNQLKFDEAIFSFNLATQLKPDYAEAQLNYIKANLAVNQHYAAIDGLKTLDKLWPDSSIVHFTRGLVFHEMADDDQAMISFQRAFELDPSNSESLVNIANIYYHQEDYPKAINLLKEAIALQADNPSAYNILGMCYAGEGNYEDALAAIEVAYTLSSNDAYVLNNRGYIQLKLKKIDMAEEDIISSMKIDPYNAWVYRNLGLLRQEQGNLVDAERMLDKAFEMDPTVDNLLADYLVVLIENKNYDKACALLRSNDGLEDFDITLTNYCNTKKK